MEKLQFNYDQVNKGKILDEMTEDPVLRNFFMDHDLSTDILEKHLNQLLSFQVENNHCLGCNGLNECKQDIPGLRPKLAFENNTIKTFYHECNFLLFRKKQFKDEKMIDAMYMPKKLLDADLSDYWTMSESRKELYKYMMRFLNLYPTGEKMKGLYIHGEYQKGKTYTLAALAKELTKKGFNIILAYYPDLVRELKSSISTGQLEPLVAKLKQIDVLMLDDIGGESHSPWVRDEILGPILQYRLLDQKATFFTSNLSVKDLALSMVENNQNAAKAKAARIAARINSLTHEYQLK